MLTHILLSSSRRAQRWSSFPVQSYPGTLGAAGERGVQPQPASFSGDATTICDCNCSASKRRVAPPRTDEQRAHAHDQPGATSASAGACWEHPPLPQRKLSTNTGMETEDHNTFFFHTMFFGSSFSDYADLDTLACDSSFSIADGLVNDSSQRGRAVPDHT